MNVSLVMTLAAALAVVPAPCSAGDPILEGDLFPAGVVPTGLTPCDPNAPEFCDGVDNNCNGQTDEGAVGTGISCGVSQAPCTPGVTACVNAQIVCLGGTFPQPERCDGVDNNCNGVVDDGPFVDAPPAEQSGCWGLSGSTCSFGGFSWDPPAGATCSDNGTLTAPCGHGTLTCSGGGWTCSGMTSPVAEVLDGVDNNCDGLVDNGVLPESGGESVPTLTWPGMALAIALIAAASLAAARRA